MYVKTEIVARTNGQNNHYEKSFYEADKVIKKDENITMTARKEMSMESTNW